MRVFLYSVWTHAEVAGTYIIVGDGSVEYMTAEQTRYIHLFRFSFQRRLTSSAGLYQKEKKKKLNALEIYLFFVYYHNNVPMAMDINHTNRTHGARRPRCFKQAATQSAAYIYRRTLRASVLPCLVLCCALMSCPVFPYPVLCSLEGESI